MSVDLNCSGYINIRRGDSFRMSFLALYSDIVDLTGYTITAWSATLDGKCIGNVEVVDIDPDEGAFDLVCDDTTAWMSDIVEIVIKFVSPDGFVDSTESIKINVLEGGCSA